MSKRPRLFVGNIPFTATEDDIREFFGGYVVVEVKIITDRDDGRSRGFAFVELEDFDAAQSAEETLDGTEMGGRRIAVNAARDRDDSPRRDDKHKNNHQRDDRRDGRGRRDSRRRE